MIKQTWEQRAAKGCIEPELVSLIQGSDLLIQRFGEWPTFEDAEVLCLNFDRGNHSWVLQTGLWEQFIPPSLCATFYVFDSRFAHDDPKRKPSKVVIRFEELEEFELDGFNYQNPILGLSIKIIYSENLNQNLFSVNWGGTGITHEASFSCIGMQVLSVGEHVA